VATFDDRGLVTDSLTAGLSLTLTKKAPESFVLGVGSDEVDVKDGSDALIVRMESASSYEDALNRGVDLAQRGLDLLAVSRATSLAVERTHTKHVVWWTSDGKLSVRCVIFFGLTFDARPASLTVKDASGRVVQPQVVPLVWHPSLRYFRLSQITGDLIDAYRNMFLALESILSDLRPPRPNEGEGVWLKAAFNDAHARYDLSHFFTAKSNDAGADLHDDFAVDARHLVNHAKVNRGTILPLHRAHANTLQNKHQRLGGLVQYLLEKHLNLRRGTGGLFAVAFRRMVEGMAAKGLRIGVTDDGTERHEDDTEIQFSQGSQVLWSEPLPAPEYDEPSRRAFIATWDSGTLSQLQVVRQCLSSRPDGSPVSYGDLSGPMTTDGIDRLEVVNGYYYTNLRMNKVDYAT
jgi:hypothetical protein